MRPVDSPHPVYINIDATSLPATSDAIHSPWEQRPHRPDRPYVDRPEASYFAQQEQTSDDYDNGHASTNDEFSNAVDTVKFRGKNVKIVIPLLLNTATCCTQL